MSLAVRQIASVTNVGSAASSTLAVQWPANTLLGSRIYLAIATGDNSVTVTGAVPAGWTFVNPPGKVTRQASGLDRISVRLWEQKNAAVQTGATNVIVSFTSGGSPVSVYAELYLIEVTGADVTADAQVQVSGVGAATFVSVGPYSTPTTTPNCIHIALIASGNKDPIADPGGGAMNGFTIAAQAGGGGASNNAIVESAILTKIVSSVGNQTATVNLSGATVNRNYAWLMIGLPMASAGGGGGGGGGPIFGMDDTNDGRIHRAISLHYYSAAGSMSQANAVKIASLSDLLCANVEIDPNTAGVDTLVVDRFNALTAQMQATKPNIKLLTYNKSAEISEGATFFPNTYYAHNAPWPTGAKLTTFSGSIYVAQPDHNGVLATYKDPRGWTAVTFKEERARKAWWNLDEYNAKNPSAPAGSGPGRLTGIYLDSMGRSTYKGTQVDPTSNTPYTADAWIPLVWSIGDEAVSRGGGRMVWGNGLTNGPSYFSGTPGGTGLSGLLSHVDGGTAENWIHSNYSSVSAFPTETVWGQAVDMITNANSLGKGIWCVVNIANNVAGTPPAGWSNPTAAQLEVQRRYSMASYMFGKRSSAWFEFCQSAGNGASDVMPWDEDHPYYHVDLGAPIDNWANAAAGKSGGLYRRKFQKGIVVINPTTTSGVFTYDRDYLDPGKGQPGPGATDLTGASGTTLLVQPNTAFILTITPSLGANAGAPTAAFVSPDPTATSVTDNPLLVSITAADPDGIAGVSLSFVDAADGVTIKTVPMTSVGGFWQLSVPMIDGSNALTAVITDDNVSPLSTTITTSVTWTQPVTPPTAEPVDLSTYDLIADDLGLMLYRGDDDANPDRVYKTEPADSTFAPVFIDRTNVSGDLGDDTQAFYMTFVQRDWSEGMGQKYFRQLTDNQSRFWEGKNIDVSTPGSVRLGAKQLAAQVPGGVNLWCNAVPFRNPGNTNSLGIGSPFNGMLRLDNAGTSAKVIMRHSEDGGATWTIQATSSATTWSDNGDLVVGDDGTLYALEGNTGATSFIHKIGLPGTATTLAWDNSTGITGGGACHLITYFQGKVYVATRQAVLKQITTFGSSAPQATIHDFGGGRIVDLLATPAGIYVLYGDNENQYRLFLYDGTNTTEVAHLPSGWSYQAPHASNMDAVGNAPAVNSTHCMAYADGILYVGGLLPAKDYVQSQQHQTAYRQSLWFYAQSGTASGLIWASETLRNDWRRGSGGALCVIRGDNIVWLDGTSNRLMRYDPSSGGVSALGTYTLSTPTNINNDQTVNGALNATAQTLVIASATTMGLAPGSVISTNATDELALVTTVVNPTTYQIIRGYQGTTPSSASFQNGATLIVQPPLPAPHRLVYDSNTDKLMIVWYPTAPAGWAASTALIGNRLDFFDLSYGPAFNSSDAGLMATSAFDFNSSLQKYFRSVAIDGEFTQFARRTDEVPGTFDIYYVLDGIASTTADAQLVVQNATPGQFYDINTLGQSLSVLVQLNPGTASPSQPISQGPVLTRVSVKGVPVMPGYRIRKFQVCMFNNMPTKSGIEELTPAELYARLVALIRSNTPILVSDAYMTSVSMVFEPENCVIRELRPGEFIAYIQLREV